MSEFKDRLWRELVREHGAELAQISRPPAIPGRRVRPRVLAGATLGLVAVGTVLALALGATRSSPAFAVDRNPDGTLSLTIRRIEGIRGANARLAALGVRVRAVPVMAGCAATRRTVKVPPGSPPPWRVRRAPGSVAIDPRKIRRGETLVVAAKPAHDRGVTLVGPKIVRGEIPLCMGPAAVARNHTVSCHNADGVAVPPPNGVPPSPPATGNSNSGSSGSGSSGSGSSGTGSSGTGNSGTGNSGGITCELVPPQGGNSGNSGSSGTGNS